jgi:hypothetical protein
LIEQLRRHLPETSTGERVELSRGRASWRIEEDLLMLDWRVSTELFVSLKAKGIELAELVRIAESLRPALSTG